MKWVKQLFDFYIFSNIHVALATFSFTKISLLHYHIKENTIPFFVFFSTIFAYNLIRFYELRFSKTNWFKDWFAKNQAFLKILTLMSFFAIAYFIQFCSITALIVLIPFMLITMFYAIPMLHYKGKWLSIRNYPTLKIFSIGIAWAGITVLFPIVNHHIEVNGNVLLLFLQRIFLVIVITIPFDIRDISYDDSSLKTIPQLYGIQNTKYIGVVLLAMVVFIDFYLFSNGDLSFLKINLIGVLITLGFLLKSSENQSKYYSSFFVESIPIVWLLLLSLNF